MTDKMIPAPRELLEALLKDGESCVSLPFRLAFDQLLREAAQPDRRVCVYDLAPASDVESAIRKKLVEMGWKPPTSPADKELRRDAERYKELLFAVASKFPGESRHETALRYIRSAEKTLHGPVSAPAPEKREGS